MDRRTINGRDRRVHANGGRREGERKTPWYLRHRIWLAAASLVFVGWRRVRGHGPRLGK